MKHILIAFSWSSGNIGDIGITPGLFNLLKQHLPEIPVSILALQREKDKNYNKIIETVSQDLPKCSIIPNPFHHATFRSIATWNEFCLRWPEHKLQAFERGCISVNEAKLIVNDILEILPYSLIEYFKKYNPRAYEIFINAGFIVYNSGTTINFGRIGVRKFWSYTFARSLPLVLARALNIPYGINAQSFEAIDWPADIYMKNIFKNAKFVYCRDGDSLEYLRDRDLNVCNITDISPDSTFFYRKIDSDWSSVFLEKNELFNRQFITITIRTSRASGPLPADTLAPDRENRNISKIQDFIEMWIANTGLKVLLCPETSSDLESTYKMIYEKLSDKTKKSCVCLDSFWTPSQALATYKDARIVISMEMHSIIMAASTGTPVIHPRFLESGRKSMMLKDMGLEKWLLDIDEMSSADLLNTAIDIHKNFTGSCEILEQSMKHVRNSALGMISKIKEFGEW